MNRIHAILIALLFGVAGMAGGVALAHTTTLATLDGSKPKAQSTVNAADVFTRAATLAREENSLNRALAQRPPKLPPLPHHPKIKISPPASRSIPAVSYSGGNQGYATPARRVAYVAHRSPSTHTTSSPSAAQSGSEHEQERQDD